MSLKAHARISGDSIWIRIHRHHEILDFTPEITFVRRMCEGRRARTAFAGFHLLLPPSPARPQQWQNDGPAAFWRWSLPIAVRQLFLRNRHARYSPTHSL